MSDALNEDGRFFGHQLIRKSQTGSLRERMEAFAAEHAEGGVRTVRKQVSPDGTDLSTLVSEGREERL